MISLLKVFATLMIVALFIYSKVNIHENLISQKFTKPYSIIKSILKPILDLLKKIFRPYQIGRGLSIDTSQICLLIILLLVVKS